VKDGGVSFLLVLHMQLFTRHCQWRACRWEN